MDVKEQGRQDGRNQGTKHLSPPLASCPTRNSRLMNCKAGLRTGERRLWLAPVRAFPESALLSSGCLRTFSLTVAGAVQASHLFPVSSATREPRRGHLATESHAIIGLRAKARAHQKTLSRRPLRALPHDQEPLSETPLIS